MKTEYKQEQKNNNEKIRMKRLAKQSNWRIQAGDKLLFINHIRSITCNYLVHGRKQLTGEYEAFFVCFVVYNQNVIECRNRLFIYIISFNSIK